MVKVRELTRVPEPSDYEIIEKVYDYVITHSGREVSLTRGVPTIEDIALSLSRQPRYGGMCRRHWSVLDHSLYTSILAEHDAQTPKVQLVALLHDAHEWTGDIPTHFKAVAQRSLQRILDLDIFEAYVPGAFPGGELDIMKEYDRRALLAEAMVVGPPLFKMSTDVLAHFGDRPRLRDVIALINRVNDGELGVSGSELDFGLEASNVQKFLGRLRALQLLTTTQESR